MRVPNISFKYQLIGALALVTFLAVVIVYLLADQAIQARFAEFRGRAVGAQVRHLRYFLAEYYVRNGSWEGLHRLFEDRFEGREQRVEQPLLVANREGRVVFSSDEALWGKQLSANDLASGWPILVNQQRVGTILLRLPPRALTPLEQQFVQSVHSSILLAGLAALAVALVLGFWLMRCLAQPLTELRVAAEQIAQGQLDSKVSLAGRDELGRLGEAFNSMSDSLHRSENLRRQMVLDIAHELRTPLMVQQSHLELLVDKVTAPSDQQLETIYEQNLLLGRLVRDLQELALAEAGEICIEQTAVPLGDILETIVKHMRPAMAEKRISLQLPVGAIHELPLLLFADRQRVEQVLFNLLDNARRYTPAGGTIWVESHTLNEQFVQISIRDSGPGLSQEDLQQVFERFYHADKSRARSSGGTGLGLAIAQALVEAHGGRIWAENAHNGGACFHFTLPIASDQRVGATGRSPLLPYGRGAGGEVPQD